VLERAATSFDAWILEMERTIDDVRIEVGKLSKHWERMVWDRSPPLISATPATSLPKPPSQAGDPKSKQLGDLAN
jgi:hypothetical protein